MLESPGQRSGTETQEVTASHRPLPIVIPHGYRLNTESGDEPEAVQLLIVMR